MALTIFYIIYPIFGRNVEIFYITMSVPRNIVMDLNNVMLVSSNIKYLFHIA